MLYQCSCDVIVGVSVVRLQGTVKVLGNTFSTLGEYLLITVGLNNS